MKTIFTALILFAAFTATAQVGARGVSAKDFQDLTGTWTGKLVYTDYGDDKTQVSLPAQAQIVYLKDSVLMNFTYTEPNGKQVIDKGSLRMYGDGDKISINGEEYLVNAVRRKGVRLSIIAEKEGTDINKEAIIRKTVIMGPGILIINKYVQYTGAKTWLLRNKTELSKK